jgi:hypothetical protein
MSDSLRALSCLFVLGVALLSAPSAHACSVCYCGDPTLLPLGIIQPESGQLRLSFDGSFLHKETGDPQSTLRHANGQGVESHDELRLLMTGSLTLGDTSFALSVPWLAKSLEERQGAAIRRDSLAGPGDIELYAKQQWFLNHRISPIRHVVALSVGVKLPTGQGAEDIHLSPGSGSFDVMLGPSYTYDADPFSLYASILGRYNGEGFDGARFGSSLLVNLAARYRLNDYVLVATQLNGRVTGQDKEAELVEPDSGGMIFFVTPQVIVRPKKTLAMRASVQLPALNRLYGEQSESPVFQLGASYDL